ncbi:MAG: YfdX family protein [Chromatiales bacterium]|jgi:hypothetical protein
MYKRFALKPVAAAVLLAAVAASGSVLADGSIQEDLTVTPGRQISPQDEAAISSAAVKVLRHVAGARGELQGDEPDAEKAKVELGQAEKLLDIIQAGLPTTRIKDHIWVAKKDLEYEDSREVLPDLVPIYASLDELVDYMPKARAHLDQAREAVKAGDKSKAGEQLKALDDALVYAEADLPLSSTRNLVAEAEEDLANDDAKAADAALATAQDDVVFVTVSFQSPLTNAKAALWRAWQDYRLGEKEYAKADLDEAVGYLERVAQSDDEVMRQAAENLVAEVRDLHGSIEAGDERFGAAIEGAWHRVRALSERAAESISTGWQRLRAEGAGKEDLIEAKLQLAYARIDHLYSADDAAAKVDLAEARGYLDSALREARPEVKDEVEQVSALVAGLDSALQGGKQAGSDEGAFDKAEAQLGALIHQI